jgi:hypothetical protein
MKMPKTLPLIYGASLILGGTTFAIALPTAPSAPQTETSVAMVDFDDSGDDRYGSDSDAGPARHWRPRWDDRQHRSLPIQSRHHNPDFDSSDGDFDSSHGGSD